MITFKIENNDLVLDGQRNLVLVEGKEEEKQSIERTLTTRQEEWFLNILHGLDYENILGKFNEEQARLAIVEAISQDTRVESVEQVVFDTDRQNRKLTVFVEVKMQSGNIIEGVIPLE